MNILIFEYEHMAIEDLREALTNLGHTLHILLLQTKIFITMSMKLLMHALTI